MTKRRKFDPSVDVARLYGALAEGIVRVCIDFRVIPQPARSLPPGQVEPVRAKKGDNVCGYWGGEISNFKAAAGNLRELNVAAPTTWPPKAYFWVYEAQLLIDGIEVSDFVTKRVRDGNGKIPYIDDLLRNFISCAAQLDLIGFREGETFAGHDNLQSVLNELHHSRYLGRVNGQWRWTSRAATAFQLEGIWSATDLASDELIYEGAIDDELRTMIGSMPQNIRDLKEDEEMLWLMVSHCWKGDRTWSALPDSSQHIDLVGRPARAFRLAKLLQESEKR
jgi:hypothetical protein